MKKSKRLLSLLLALTMAFSLVGNAAVAAWADDVPQSPETVASDNGENAPSDPDKNTDPTDNGGTGDANEGGSTGDADADKATTDDASTSGDETPANGDETPAETETVTVPTRKASYPAETSATVQTGTAYLLSDLQSGKIFESAEGQKLNYQNYYYQRSTDGGNTWDAMTGFSNAIFGATTIQITETKAGTYMYRFYASHDGVNFSTDTWTLTLTVEDAPTLEFSFYVGKDYNGNYPIIKLYNVEKDDQGNEVLGDEIENVFLYSSFTDTLPEGETEYDPAMGKLVSNYQMFYAKLTAGRYAYRAFGWNTETEAYDVALGGMTLNLPTDKNVDGGAGGGGAVYLQCNSFYVSTKKTDNTYFTADEYHVRVDCPIMGCSTAMGDPYISGNYTYYPTMLYAAGNACLYNLYAYPDIDGYIFTQTINQTYRASAYASTKSLTLNIATDLTVTVPADATFGLYFQWNNFNTTEVAPDGEEDVPYADRWTYSTDGKTKKATYTISKGNGNYTWRLSDDDHVTRSGWLTNVDNGSITLDFNGAATDRLSHDFSKLGSIVTTRDEADLQVNLDPTGFEAITDTTRVRAYRHWQLINSDAGNIMVEPDFHWNVLRGDADYEPVNGGNTTANWADITPGTQDSIITVYYDSVDVTSLDISTNAHSVGSHGGVFPATNPERVGVMVVGGTGVTHGTADAKVKFNMASGATTTRSLDWDYNYDTWSYGANETNPTLDFTVTATGSVDVEYAFVTTDNSMNSNISTDFTSVSPDGSGKYVVPLAAFNKSGNGMGGTVIIKMTDETGVSYRLVRVAKVTITSENVSNPGEDIMPGDQVKLSFKGMYRSVNKISGIFNPTNFKPTYYAGDTKFEGTLGQYQKMDNATVTVTIPEDVTFADGAATTEYAFTNGYTFGSMYSAANPFAFLYNMTDAGVGTNFNAVTVTYYLNHYADAVVTVYQKATYTVKLNITDDSGNAVDGVTVTLLGRDGKTVTPNEDGTYTLGYGTYTYTLSKNGYVLTRGSFSLGSADAGKVQDDVLTVKTAVMPVAGAKAWDGTAKTEPAKDESGVYQISTAAELAWFAANGGSASAKLTADIDLAGYDWTPMNKLYGTFDGDGHMVKNLYINSASYPLGIFGYLQNGAKVLDLGVSGNVTCTASSNAQAGGIAGYMNSGSSIENCYSSVNVNSKKHAGGIAGYTASGAVITNCYASGDITTTSANECFLGGIAASYYARSDGATLTNCYSIATVTGTSGNASYLGGLTPSTNTANYVGSCFYLENTVTKESSKYGVTGLGTAKTAAEMKAAVEANEHPFKAQMLADMKSWDGVTTTEPAKDADGAYMIGTAAELAWFAQAVNEGQYALNAVLTADIDLENEPWTPIGNNTAATTTGEVMYKGVFNGQGHVVKNLYINNADSKQGLFSYVGGTVKNLGVTGSITTTGKFVGGIVGYLSSGKVENCYSAVTVSAAQNAGGIVGGGHANTTISYCYNAGNVTTTGARVGGIVSCAAMGFINGPTLDNCCNIGSVSGTSFVGGIASINKASCFGANLYYLNTCIKATNYGKGTAKTETELLTLLGAAEGDTLQTALFNKWAGQVTAAADAEVKAVIDAIEAIPQPVALSSKAKIITAEKLYNALTATQKEKVTNADILRAARAELDRLEAEQAAADKAAADAVIAKINAIGEVTLEKETSIKEARAAYDALTTVQKNLVKNDGALTTLEAAEATLKQLKADKEQADAVIGWINGLNDPITLAEEQGVQNIRKRYDSLTDAQKALVTNLGKLEKAEKQLTELKAAIADTESKIDAIGTVELTDACKAKIDAARDAYDALNKEQQAKVSNYETLTDAEAEYQKLADKAAADKAAADAVIAKISAIGKVELTADCKAKIDAAREAYNALSDEQKELVSNLKALTDAEDEYKSLADKAAADKVAADAVIDKINAIGNVTKDSGDAIKDARDAYDKLTDDQKKLVPDEILKKLTDAESTYKDLTAPRPRPSDKTNTKTDGKGVKSQNTGDNSQMTLWLSGVLLSAAALLLLAKKRRQDA